MPRKKNTCMYLVAALLFLGGLGYLVFSGLSENTVYFLNVSEARAATADKLQAARLFGTVAPDNLLKNVDGPGELFAAGQGRCGPDPARGLQGRRAGYLQGGRRGHRGRGPAARRPFHGQDPHDQVSFQVPEGKPQELGRRRPYPS